MPLSKPHPYPLTMLISVGGVKYIGGVKLTIL